jgi:hypothetical protein
MSKRLFRRGLALAAVLAVGCAALAIAAATSRSYLGKTSQGQTVVVGVTGKRVSTFAILFAAKCPRGGTKAGAGSFGWTGKQRFVVQLDRKGHFKHSETLGGITKTKKFRFRLTVHITGHVTQARASGTFSGLFRFYTRKGKFTESCPTGKLSWSAH